MKQTSTIANNPTKRKIGIKICVEIIVTLLILLWIYTSINKLLDHDNTRFQMGRSPYIQPIADFAAWAIPLVELAIAGLLVFGKTRMIGLLASFSLMLLFTGYIYLMLHYSPYIPCSCGGVLGTLSWDDHYKFNIIYTLIALTGVTLQAKLQKK